MAVIPMKNVKLKLISQNGNALIMVIVMLVILVTISGVLVTATMTTVQLSRVDMDSSEVFFIARSGAELVRDEIVGMLNRLDILQREMNDLNQTISTSDPNTDNDWYEMAVMRMRVLSGQADALVDDINNRMVPVEGKYTHIVNLEGSIVTVSVQRVDGQIVISAKATVASENGLSELNDYAELSIESATNKSSFNYSYTKKYDTNPFDYAITAVEDVKSFSVYGGIHAGGDVLSYGQKLSGTIRSGGLVSTDITGRVFDNYGYRASAGITGDVISEKGLYTGYVSGNLYSDKDVLVRSCSGDAFVKTGATFSLYRRDIFEIDPSLPLLESHSQKLPGVVNVGNVKVTFTNFTYPGAAKVELWDSVMLENICNEIKKRSVVIPPGVLNVENDDPRFFWLKDRFFTNEDYVIIDYEDTDTIYFYSDATSLPKNMVLHKGGIKNFSDLQVVILAPYLEGTLNLNGWLLSGADFFLYAPNLTLHNATGNGMKINGSLFVKSFSGGESNYVKNTELLHENPYNKHGYDVTLSEFRADLAADLGIVQNGRTNGGSSDSFSSITYSNGDTLWRRPTMTVDN
jgi:hypothetical protein